MTQVKIPHVVITGGGTGGHITPALAVGEALLEAGAFVSFIGSPASFEAPVIKAAGYQFYPIQAGKLRRYWSWANVVDFGRVIVGFFQARRILARLKPDVIFAKGGYVCVPVVYAAAFLEIPIVAHESDVILGLANRLIFEKTQLVCTGFPVKSYPVSLRAKLRFTGNPVRSIFMSRRVMPESTLKKLKFSRLAPVVLFLGGSQGAHAINELVFNDLAESLDHYQIIHFTGVADVAAAEALKAKLPKRLAKAYQPFAYVEAELVALLRLADLVVCRSGANTLAELAVLGKAAVLIPLPSAASGHQLANARVFAAQDAAIILEEDRLTAAELTTAVTALLDDPERMKGLSRSIRLFASPKAAQIIAEHILGVI